MTPSLEDDTEEVSPPDTEETGSLGPQSVMTPAEATSVVCTAPTDSRGLTTISTAEQLAELARSDEPAEVKRDIVVGMLLGAHQGAQADLRFRLQGTERELAKVRRQLAAANEEAGNLTGDVRVRDERIGHLHAHRNREAFLAFVSSILFGIGGAFIGRSLPATLIGFGAGLLLFIYGWFHAPFDSAGKQ